MNSRLLLLNPPGNGIVVRDYYCSKISQGDNVTHPIDLVAQSGILSEVFDVNYLDAAPRQLSTSVVMDEIIRIQPDIILSLVGSVCLPNDLEFLKQLKCAMPSVRLVVSGDAFIEDAERYLSDYPFLEAILLDFASTGMRDYLCGTDECTDVVARDEHGLPIRYPRSSGKRFTLPLPRHDLFKAFPYRHSLIHGNRFITTITDYGCPFPCTFCIMNQLGYKVRDVENIIAELRYAKQLGINEVFFLSQTFGAHMGESRKLCERMIEEKLNMGWVCFSRVDVAKGDFLNLMKNAGCHGIIYGIESGSDRILKAYRKNYTISQVMETIDQCNQMGIETTGTFILGLPEEDADTMAATLDLLRRIKLDYAGINVAAPRVGTGLRQEALDKGLIEKDCFIMDQSGTTITMPSSSLSRNDIERFKREAIRSFYLRPSYIWRRFRRTHHGDLIKMARNAWGLIRTTWMNQQT